MDSSQQAAAGPFHLLRGRPTCAAQGGVEGPLEPRAVHGDDAAQPLGAKAQAQQHLLPVLQLGIVQFQMLQLAYESCELGLQSAAPCRGLPCRCRTCRHAPLSGWLSGPRTCAARHAISIHTATTRGVNQLLQYKLADRLNRLPAEMLRLVASAGCDILRADVPFSAIASKTCRSARPVPGW
jgi:hypothetical protein